MDLNTLRDIPPRHWPGGALQLLSGVLRNRRADPSTRLLAAELAGDVALDDAIADSLLSILRRNDESEDLQSRAVVSLGSPAGGPVSRCREIQQELRQIYFDKRTAKEVRRRILEASMRSPQGWHLDAVCAAWAQPDEDWRLTAVFCMRFLSGFEREILAALRDENAEIHYEAVCAAGSWRIDAAWPHIAALVGDGRTGKPLRLAAIEAAVSVRPLEAIELLHPLMHCDDVDIADAAEDAVRGVAALPEPAIPDGYRPKIRFAAGGMPRN